MKMIIISNIISFHSQKIVISNAGWLKEAKQDKQMWKSMRTTFRTDLLRFQCIFELCLSLLQSNYV